MKWASDELNTIKLKTRFVSVIMLGIILALGTARLPLSGLASSTPPLTYTTTITYPSTSYITTVTHPSTTYTTTITHPSFTSTLTIIHTSTTSTTSTSTSHTSTTSTTSKTTTTTTTSTTSSTSTPTVRTTTTTITTASATSTTTTTLMTSTTITTSTSVISTTTAYPIPSYPPVTVYFTNVGGGYNYNITYGATTITGSNNEPIAIPLTGLFAGETITIDASLASCAGTATLTAQLYLNGAVVALGTMVCTGSPINIVYTV